MVVFIYSFVYLHWCFRLGLSGLKLEVIFLPQLLSCWDYRCGPPWPSLVAFINLNYQSTRYFLSGETIKFWFSFFTRYRYIQIVSSGTKFGHLSLSRNFFFNWESNLRLCTCYIPSPLFLGEGHLKILNWSADLCST